MVEFQVRPQTEKHLWFAFNVLDWPQDSEGQVQDIDGATYANVAQAANRLPDANEDGGDMKLIPMLEIRIPQSSANLPTTADLLPFNITLNDLTPDGQTQVAYVPLTIITDERSGQRIGFSGQMRYQPTGSWDTPHEVRLAWVVQALVDVVCNPQDQEDVARGCQADGYIHNNPQVIQSYYDDWTLTGLTVREDHGADMAIIYEDPTIDDNLKDDKAIWSLSYVLDHHFLIARDANNDSQRDLTLADIDQRFDHTRNSGVSDDQRFAVPNILRVEKQSYEMLEQAVAFTAMTKTQEILANFVTAASADRDVKPLLFFAQEARSRMLGTDLLTAPGNYASESGASLTFDMAPSGQTAQPVDVMAGLKWAGYCGSTDLPLTWSGCSAETYWETLAQRYGNLPSLPGDESPDWVKGRLQLAQLYYLGFATGNYRVVQSGVELAPFAYSLDSEATTTTQVRAVLQGLSLVPLEAALGFERAFAVVLSSAFLRKQGVIEYGITLYKGLEKSKAAVASAKLGSNQKLIDAEVKDLKLKQAGALKFFGSPFATIGAMFSIAAQIASLSPTVPLTDRTILGTFSLVTNIAVNVVLTSAEVGMGIRAGKATVKEVLSGVSKVSKAVKIGNGIGLAITVVATWGFFIYSAVSTGTAAGTPALNKAAVEAIAATIIAVLLFALAFTVVGLIITLIFAVIEGILTLICELGVDELRVLGGACFTFTTAAIKAAGYFIYNSDIMVDLERDDLVTAGAPDIALLNPTQGMVGGNPLTITLPVTTTLYHKDADAKNGLMIFFYHYLFSSDNLKSSTFHYSLTHPGPFTHSPGRNGMTDQWLDVVEDHKQNNVQSMYRGYAKTSVAVGGVELQPGLNQVAQYYFNMGYAVPVYECFVPLPLFIPVCHTDKSQTGNQSTNYETLKFDVFPTTLDGFMALTPKADGGLGLQWDARFPSLYDVDGDGLRSAFHGGIDPNDGSVDADNDGLSDRYELERRAAGSSLSPIISDSDSDGLSDFREMELGSDPGIADTDNDGLSDSVELAGWDVTINAQTPFVVHVTADPYLADSDGDGLSDQAERELALSPVPANRLDQQNRPYHPNVFNTPPIAIFQSTDDFDGILGPNQAFIYTTTVVANQPLAPGVLTITAPNGISGAGAPYALGFNPAATGAQTVTNASNLQVNNLSTGEIVLTSTVNTRLPGGDITLAWQPATSETGLGTAGKSGAFIYGAPALPDRQDTYRLLAQSVITPGIFFSPGDVLAYTLPTGAVRNLEVDPLNPAWRVNSSPAITCNDLGVCMAVWSEKPGGLAGPPARIAAARITADGTVTHRFAVSAPVDPSEGDSQPVVATDGIFFLVAWQRLDGYSRDLTPTTATIAFRTELMTRFYDGAGFALTPETTLTGDRLEFYSANIATTSALNRVRSNLNRLDLDWIGDRYRLTRGIALGDAANDPNLLFEDNGAPGSTRLLTWRDISPVGVLIPGSKATVYNDADTSVNGSHSLVYNPSSREILLVQTRFFTVLAQQFSSPAQTTAGTTVVGGAAAKAVASYYAPLRGYLIGWTDTFNNPNTSATVGPFRYQVRDRFFQVVGGAQQLTWPVAVNATAGTALACPAPQSAPTIELRFEEFPGSNGFENAADIGTPAGCSGSSCPAAGFPGAPNAPRSDYAVQFDGVDDSVTAPGNAPGSFSVALWLKVSSGQSGVVVDHGLAQSKGWGLTLINGAPALQFDFGHVHVSPTKIDDGAWHHVVATRQIETGAVTIYVDGVQQLNAIETDQRLLDTATTLVLGWNRANATTFFKGQVDHLQLYRTVLSTNTVQALFNRTLQSYCVVAGAASNGTLFPWSRLSLTEQDQRGGRISASQGLPLLIDSNPPTASMTAPANNSFIPANATTIIGGNAIDPIGVAGITPSGVGQVEVQVNGGTWQVAEGSTTWSFALTAGTGNVTLRVRATDAVGNVGPESAPITLRTDGTAPQVTLNAPANTVVPTQNADGEWLVTLTGTANDGTGSGVKPGSVEILLTQQSGVGPLLTWQPATLTGNNWTINYALPAGFDQVTDAYNIQVRANDNLDNRTADNAASGIVRLDNAAPTATLTAIAGQSPGTQLVISQTVTLSGIVTDSNSIAGLQTLEIAFTTMEQIAALPEGVTGDAAEALLNRTWLPVTLPQRGAGQATSPWSFAVPAGLEHQYQISLRATDMLGNRSINGNAWRGAIDTLDPRVRMTATATGASYFDAASNQQMNEIRFVCTATDRHLTEESFVCPGNSIQPPVRTFTNDPALQAIFPDQTIRSGLANTYTLWLSTTTPIAAMSVCDVVGRCATASTPSTGSGAGGRAVQATAIRAAAAPGAPTAVIVNPTSGSFVAAGNGSTTSAISVTVAAEAGAGLKEVTIKLDNATVQTLNFAQSPAITRTLRTINVPVATEGPHTLVAQATAWDNSTQTTLFPVVFTLDQNAPTLTIDASTLTLADTWQEGSGILRFNGNTSDSVGLAAVQIREGNGEFVDAQFGNGTWRTALPVADPEGRTLNITVRAIDRAGRITQLNQALATDLSAADAPDTTISSGPTNPSATNSAQFVFSGSATTAAFECSLDNGVYTPCASPTSYSDLSKGSHTFRVRAIDGRGLPDLTPAEFTWSINAVQPDATITGKPTNPTTERTATFTFAGDATATRFECSLDGSAYATCTSPQVYNNLGNGEHTFLVRAVDSGGKRGAADRYTWTVVNLAPVASSQTLITAFQTAVAVTLAATDSDPLLYKIVNGPAHGVLLGVAPNLTYSPDQGFGGIDRFTFVANDGLVDSTVATVTIYVDNVPPVSTITLTPATPTGQNGWYTSTVQVVVSATDGPNGSGVTETRCVLNPAAAPTSFATIPAGCAYSGAGATVSADRIHNLYAASIDLAQNGETPVSKAFQIDLTPPTVTCSATPNNVWPPNNQFVTINTTVTVNDATSGPAGFVLRSVTNNETGAGDVQGWTVGTPDTQGQIRASRNGNGNGRIYTLTYQGRDVAGNRAICSTTVTVPKSQGGRAGATDEATPLMENVLTDTITIPTNTVTILTETVSMPTDAVTTLVTETINSEIVTSNPEVGALRLFLPIIVIGSVGEQSETAPTESAEATGATAPTMDAPATDVLTVESEHMTEELAPPSEEQTDAGNTLYLPVIDQ
jgi:hypothetical protein